MAFHRKELLNDTHSITVLWSLKALQIPIVLSTEISKAHDLTVALVEKGQRLTDPQEQCRGFATYYEDLAIPKDSSSFDDDYKSRVSANLHLIRNTLLNQLYGGFLYLHTCTTVSEDYRK